METVVRSTPGRVRVTRVLIADDHDVIRTGLGRLVRSQPDLTLVGIASDGLTAVRLALIGEPDVVVMDLAMPELDGIAATREIVRHIPGVRVVLLTGYADQAMARAAMSAGACRCVSKADTVADVLGAIRAVGAGVRP